MVFKNFLSKAKDIDILSFIPDGVLLVDNSGKIEWINDAVSEILSISKNDIFKLSFNELVEGGSELVRQAAASAKSAVGRVKRDSLKEFYVEITAKLADDYYVVSLRDVTQSYKTVTNILVEHESSKKVNKDKNAFLVKLSNELKSPVHSIMGFSQAMIDGLGGEMSDKQDKYIRIINKNSNEMLYMMDKILELSKTESNLFEYDFQTFDIINLAQNVIKNNETPIKQKNLNFNFVADELEKKIIFSDEGALKIIIQNLIETSINSTDIGSITLKLSHPALDFVSANGIELEEHYTDKSFVHLALLDTGAGVSEGDLGVIFEPYAWLDRPNKKNIVRAIALASAKNLVKHLGGVVSVHSEPMQGTLYSVILPIEKE